MLSIVCVPWCLRLSRFSENFNEQTRALLHMGSLIKLCERFCDEFEDNLGKWFAEAIRLQSGDQHFIAICWGCSWLQRGFNETALRSRITAGSFVSNTLGHRTKILQIASNYLLLVLRLLSLAGFYGYRNFITWSADTHWNIYELSCHRLG